MLVNRDNVEKMLRTLDTETLLAALRVATGDTPGVPQGDMSPAILQGAGVELDPDEFLRETWQDLKVAIGTPPSATQRLIRPELYAEAREMRPPALGTYAVQPSDTLSPEDYQEGYYGVTG